MQLHKGKLGCPVDRHEEVELAFLGADLCDVDVEIANWIGLELAPGEWLCALRSWQPRDSVALEAAVQQRAGQVRQRRLQGIQAVVQQQQRVPAKGTTVASSSGDIVVIDNLPCHKVAGIQEEIAKRLEPYPSRKDFAL